MPDRKFTMEEIDQQIIQIIEQSERLQTQKQPPQLLQKLMARAKAKRTEK